MGFFDILEDVVDAGGSLARGAYRGVSGAGRRTGRMAAANARGFGDVLGAVGDLYTAAVRYEDREEFMATVEAIALNRGGDLAGNMFGPKGLFGEAFEGIPESARGVGLSGLEKYDDAYRAVAHVPASVVAAINISGNAAYQTEYTPEGGVALANPELTPGIKGLFDRDVWEAAWDATSPHEMTLGQTVSFALADVDVLDEKEQAHYEGTRWHQMVSGGVDFVSIMALDPTILGGKAFNVARGAGRIGQALSRLGLGGSSMRVAPAIRRGSATDRLILRPAMRRRYGGDWREMSGMVTEEVGGTVFRSEMTLHELGLAGGRQGIRNRLATQIARREHFFSTSRGFRSLADDIVGFYDEAAEAGVTIGRSADETAELVSAQVREAYFPRHPHGGQISQLLTRSLNGHVPSAGGATNYELGENIMRFFLGDNRSLIGIAEHSEEAAGFVRGMFVRSATVTPGAMPGQVGAHANQFTTAQHVSSPTGIGEMAGGFGQLERLVSPSGYTAARTGIQQSGWYRNGVTGSPVRWVFDRKPHRSVLFASTDSDTQIVRMLQAAGRNPDEIASVRGAWMSADEVGRRAMFPRLVEENIEFVIRRHLPNLPDGEMDQMVSMLKDDYIRSVGASQEALTQSRTKGFGIVDEAGETAHLFADPMAPEMLSDLGLVPDFWRYNTVARRKSMEWMWGSDFLWGASDWTQNAFTVMTNVWKPSVLLNPKWPIRVVAMDEQARLAAVAGGLDTVFDMLITGRRDLIDVALIEKLGGEAAVLSRSEISLLKGGAFRAAPSRLAVAGVVGGLFAGPAGLAVGLTWSAIRNRSAVIRLASKATARRAAADLLAAGDPAGARAIMESAGFENLTVLGNDVRLAMGNPAQPLSEWESAAGSGSSLTYIMGRQGEKIADDAVRELGAWNQIIAPPSSLDDVAAIKDFGLRWERVVNDQLGRSAFSQKFYDSRFTDGDIVQWLRQTDEGRETLRQMNKLDNAPGELTEWVENVRSYTERLLPSGVPELVQLRRAHSQGVRLEFRQVEAALPDSWHTTLGSVHGQEAIEFPAGFRGWWSKIVDRGMHRLAELPTNTLSRHPYFRIVYEAEMRARLEMMQTGDLGAAARSTQTAAIADLNRWVDEADNAATNLLEFNQRSQNAAPGLDFPVFSVDATAVGPTDPSVGLGLFDDAVVTTNRPFNDGWSDWQNPVAPQIGGGSQVESHLNITWSGEASRPRVLDLDRPLLGGLGRGPDMQGRLSPVGDALHRLATAKKAELESLLRSGEVTDAAVGTALRTQVRNLDEVLVALDGEPMVAMAPGVVDVPLFHGAPVEISEIDPALSAIGSHGRGFYTTTNQSYAANFAGGLRTGEATADGGAGFLHNVSWAGDAPPRVLDFEEPFILGGRLTGLGDDMLVRLRSARHTPDLPPERAELIDEVISWLENPSAHEGLGLGHSPPGDSGTITGSNVFRSFGEAQPEVHQSVYAAYADAITGVTRSMDTGAPAASRSAVENASLMFREEYDAFRVGATYMSPSPHNVQHEFIYVWLDPETSLNLDVVTQGRNPVLTEASGNSGGTLLDTYAKGIFGRGGPPEGATSQQVAEALFGDRWDVLVQGNRTTQQRTQIWLDPEATEGVTQSLLRADANVELLRGARDTEVSVAAGVGSVDDAFLHGAQGEYRLSREALEAMETSSRITALSSVKWLMYDLAEQTHISESMRNFIPFFNAWQEVLSRWVGLSVKNPAFTARATAIYRELPTVKNDDGDEFLVMPIPEFARDLVGEGWIASLDNVEELHFRKSSINMVAQGLPGFSPFAMITASELVKEVPELEEVLGFMYPFGMTASSEDGTISLGTVQQMLRSTIPAWGRAGVAAFQTTELPESFGWLKAVSDRFQHGWDDRTASSAMRSIGVTWLVQMANNERPMIDFTNANERSGFLDEVEHAAAAQLRLLTFAKAISPLSIQFISPYQSEIDMYRSMALENPDTADDEFTTYLASQGIDGFFALTARATRSNLGLPPTLEAHQAQELYEDLFTQYPELGGLILGFEGGGAPRFSTAVYERSLSTETFEGSGVMQRERLSADEWLVSIRVREGWSEYRALNDLVYESLEEMGLPNLRVTGAAAQREVREKGIERIAAEFPLWDEDYRSRDTGWEKRFEGMRVMIDDERFSSRADIQLLGDYFDERDVVTGFLAAAKADGGSTKLDSGSNAWIRERWEDWIDARLQNPTFSDVYYRWLEFDQMDSATWPEAQQKMLED